MKKVLYLFFSMIILFTVVSCNNKDTKIELSYQNNEIIISIGEIVNIKPNVSKEECTLVYSLSNDNASIDNEGNLTAIKEGKVVVNVTTKEDASANATLTVTIEKAKEVIFTITYDVNGGKLPSNAVKEFKENVKVKLPKPSRSGYKFLGWYEGDELIQETCNRNLNLVARWEEIITEVSVEYVLEDGAILSNYATRADLIDALISDIQLIRGDSYTLSFFETCEDTAYNVFAGLSGNNTFFADDDMRAKWSWVLTYTKELRKASNLDFTQYDNLITKGYVTEDAATINMEMVAFIAGKQYSYDAGETLYQTSNYANYGNANNFWQTYSDFLCQNNIFDVDVYAEDVLPTASKINARFDGWYLSSDFSSSSKVDSNTVFTKDTTVYAKFTNFEGLYANITYDHNGGASSQIYEKYGTRKTSLSITSYNGDFWNNNNYSSNIFISTQANDPAALFSRRVYIAQVENSGIYQVIDVKQSGVAASWPKDAELVITVSDSYVGNFDDNFDISVVKKGDIVVFNSAFTLATQSNFVIMKVYNFKASHDVFTTLVTDESFLPGALRVGYKFLGWYDGNENKYETISDLNGKGNITLFAHWEFVDKLIGAFVDKSWVVSGESIELSAYYLSDKQTGMVWESKNPDIAIAEDNIILGVSEGVAEIVVYDPLDPTTSFTFYVSVLAEDPTGLTELIVDSNNSSIYTREDLIIGIITEAGFYYADVVGSVSKLLFEDYVVHNDYYLSNPSNYSTLVAEGIEFITFHYAADMNGSAANGGKNLAAYNKSCNQNGIQVSFHYGTGNDGIWACQNEAYGAWHAGSSKAMTWHATGIKYKEGDPEFAKITLESDNYFYLNGQKTLVQNTTTGKKLNNMGLAFKVVNGEYYISGHYYSQSYGYISSTGGNKNTIGIESAVGKGSDLWLTWQYSAQLCANLLLKYNLPLIRLVGHHFFSGKWCPQPMLEYDLEIWWEFVELVRQEMELYKNYSGAKLEFSSNSDHLNDNGRVNSLPVYSECVTYDVTYTHNGVTKTITLSSILPGAIA